MRQFSVVVFGATGFTGKYVVQELLSTDKELKHGPYAVAGRSAAKLNEVVQDINAQGSVTILANVDVSNYDSVLQVAKSCRLLLNVVGPYRLYGEPVVRACVEAGTDYLDICGEPEFIERMEFKYGDAARAAGCYVASAAGFDSIPADIGTILVQRKFQAPSAPSRVDAFITMRSGPQGYKINYATWHSAVMGMGSVDSLRQLRREVAAAGKAPSVKPLGPRPANVQGAVRSHVRHVPGYHLPFPGADAAVVRRTQALLAQSGEAPVHFTARFTLPSYYYSLVAMAVGGVMQLLAKYAWGRLLLLRYPGLFSYGLVARQGPSADQIRGCQVDVTLLGYGYSRAPEEGSSSTQKPDKQVALRLTLPDPGYKGTAMLLVNAALTLLQERESLGQPGVVTAGALLRNTSYVERIQAAGVQIQDLPM